MAQKSKQGSHVSAGDGSIVIGGDVSGSNVSLFNNNVKLTPLFKTIEKAVEKNNNLAPSDKADVTAELQEIRNELESTAPDETFLARRFRNIKRMAPEIVEVAFETLKNPVGGVAEVVKRVAAKMAEDANAK
ncbi:MAG TPA: hypothetical protein PKE23_03640 [Anaerolineales bacterium]|nr:hypothetical protein [Anaerolineales bacterium]HNB39910.1 hypothetical protein [Anaerolineales bacterium]HND48158.1 hypothetical protein [Anaerolineales bacterium]HNF94753.1 hypothetical protein [Anaerolineales bacterium]HNH25687.1 hypothetical protein [Anaerolineales bacterium]